ncbi:hypothetical protein [Methanosarcina sp. DH2]|uniref:hypothetical protein n=1 Tax=Methanosarcina sp. DH2 TaxID=2605639 RepID=UPI001E5FB81F|nr:hypothetical protein [Methanosarcina sp. DH2]
MAAFFRGSGRILHLLVIFPLPVYPAPLADILNVIRSNLPSMLLANGLGLVLLLYILRDQVPVPAGYTKRAFWRVVLSFSMSRGPCCVKFRRSSARFFDLHRFAVYEALHLPLHSDPNDEDEDGENLSQYLMRGIHLDPKVMFTHSRIKKEAEKK